MQQQKNLQGNYVLNTEKKARLKFQSECDEGLTSSNK
jgi:hypothetical protein